MIMSFIVCMKSTSEEEFLAGVLITTLPKKASLTRVKTSHVHLSVPNRSAPPWSALATGSAAEDCHAFAPEGAARIQLMDEKSLPPRMATGPVTLVLPITCKLKNICVEENP